MLMKILSLMIGGTLGTLARFFLSGATYKIFGTTFPYGTLVVNLSGCLLAGLFVSLSEAKFLLGSNARILLLMGFCGAFTTFSTWMLETNSMVKDGEIMQAMMNILVSVIAGFFFFRLGILWGEIF